MDIVIDLILIIVCLRYRQLYRDKCRFVAIQAKIIAQQKVDLAVYEEWKEMRSHRVELVNALKGRMN